MEKKLYRSRKQRILAGVCGGIAEYFNVDPVIIRLIMILLIFANGLGILFYIIAAIIIPENPEEKEVSRDVGEFPRDTRNPVLLGLILVILGIVAVLWSWGVPWIHMSPGIFLGIILVVFGLYFLVRGWK
ncbi:MAG: PspC domain-containing protein [bacterium]